MFNLRKIQLRFPQDSEASTINEESLKINASLVDFGINELEI